MCTLISVRNKSTYPVVSVYIDDRLYFSDVITFSGYRQCPSGSITITVFDNREKCIFNVYFSAAACHSYTLEVYNTCCKFIPAESF